MLSVFIMFMEEELYPKIKIKASPTRASWPRQTYTSMSFARLLMFHEHLGQELLDLCIISARISFIWFSHIMMYGSFTGEYLSKLVLWVGKMYYVSHKVVEKKLKMDLYNYMRVIETLSHDRLMIHFWNIVLILVSAWVSIQWLIVVIDICCSNKS